MTDAYSKYATNLDSPAHDFFSITPDDNTDLAQSTRGIYVGGDGNLEVHSVSGNAVIFIGVVAGSVLPIRCRRVLAASTTATNIIGLI